MNEQEPVNAELISQVDEHKEVADAEDLNQSRIEDQINDDIVPKEEVDADVDLD